MSDFDPEADIEALVDSYAAGINDHDVDAILDCFLYPSVIWQFGKGHVFADAEEMAENVKAVLKLYDEAGAVLSTPTITDVSVHGGTALVTVEWDQEDADGEAVFDFACHYHLLLDGPEWRIAGVVNIMPADDDEDEDE
ncbi:nuclear transport factor 2 family protein [Chthonobacter rhizosphaerae]|uniref:nuclear transport factor 2 family protein n=1 Tax=Chthonobacter rhizosphaerae TaxID=2735553 RepID=UPI0015EE49A7|nr:nuclear transport factor 2 family protein [Chthonobacter rhizosphaerae]